MSRKLGNLRRDIEISLSILSGEKATNTALKYGITSSRARQILTKACWIINKDIAKKCRIPGHEGKPWYWHPPLKLPMLRGYKKEIIRDIHQYLKDQGEI